MNNFSSLALASVAQLVGASSCGLKGYGFESQSEHIYPGCGFDPRWDVYEKASNIDVCLSH